MTDKITIERETLERAIADYDSAAGNDGTLLSWNRARDNLLALLRAALAAQPAPAAVPLTDEQKQEIHNTTGAGLALICLVESYIAAAGDKP